MAAETCLGQQRCVIPGGDGGDELRANHNVSSSGISSSSNTERTPKAVVVSQSERRSGGTHSIMNADVSGPAASTSSLGCRPMPGTAAATTAAAAAAAIAASAVVAKEEGTSSDETPLNEEEPQEEEVTVVDLRIPRQGPGTLGLMTEAYWAAGGAGAGAERERVVVRDVVPGQLAWMDGRISKGDILLQVADKPLEGLSQREAVDVLKAAVAQCRQADRPITLTLQRSSPGKPFSRNTSHRRTFSGTPTSPSMCRGGSGSGSSCPSPNAKAACPSASEGARATSPCSRRHIVHSSNNNIHNAATATLEASMVEVTTTAAAPSTPPSSPLPTYTTTTCSSGNSSRNHDSNISNDRSSASSPGSPGSGRFGLRKAASLAACPREICRLLFSPDRTASTSAS